MTEITISGVYMGNKALVVIDIQNDITKNYREIIGNVNAAIDRAVANDIPVVYTAVFLSCKDNKKPRCKRGFLYYNGINN